MASCTIEGMYPTVAHIQGSRQFSLVCTQTFLELEDFFKPFKPIICINVAIKAKKKITLVCKGFGGFFYLDF